MQPKIQGVSLIDNNSAPSERVTQLIPDSRTAGPAPADTRQSEMASCMAGAGSVEVDLVEWRLVLRGTEADLRSSTTS